MWWPHCLLGRKCCHQERGELPELLLSCFLLLREGEHLPGRLEILLHCFLPWEEGEQLPGKLPACLLEWPEMPPSCFLPQGKGEHLPEMLLNCLLPQGKVNTCLGVNCLEANKLLPSLEGRWVPAWEWTDWEANRLLPSQGGRWAPAWDAATLLSSPGRRWEPTWEWTTWEANKLLPSLEEEVSACLGMNCLGN